MARRSAPAPFNQQLYDAAARYEKAGLSLIPIGNNKTPREDLLPQSPETGKGTWEPYQRQRADRPTIKTWVEYGCQIAVVCGAISGGLLILDFDIERFYTAWLQHVGALADGLPVQRTGGGGYQVFLRCPSPGKNQKLAWVKNDQEVAGRSIAIETRGEGGYALVPPSLHPSGRSYEMLSGDLTSIPEVSQAHAEALINAALWLDEEPYTRQQLAAQQAAMQQKSAARQALNGSVSIIDAYNASTTIEQALEAYGYRKVSDRYAVPGHSNGSVKIENGKSFHHSSADPLNDGHWHDPFDLYSYFEHNNDSKAAAKMAATLLGIPLSIPAPAAAPSPAPAGPASPPPPTSPPPTGSGAASVPPAPGAAGAQAPQRKLDLEDSALLWAQLYGQTYAYDARLDVWRRWNDQCWELVPAGDSQLESTAIVTLRNLGLTISTVQRVNAVLHFARRHCLKSFSPKPGLINFANGTLELATMSLRAHDKADELTACLPYDFASGSFPTIAAWLAQTVPDVEARRAYMAHVGLSMLDDTKLHKALFLLGPKRSGKSTLLRLANAIAGAPAHEYESFAGPSLFDREVEGKRARAMWNQRPICCIDELPSEALRDEEAFKRMAAHSGVEMRLIGKDEQLDNRWRPKLILAANDKPRYSDRSGAVTARLVIVPCPNGLGDDRPGGQSKPLDMHLFEKLLPEMPAFAAECLLWGLKVLADGAYPSSQAMRELLRDIEVSGDAVKGFIEEDCILDPSAWADSASLYNRYKIYCQENGHQHPMAKVKLTNALIERYTMLQPKRGTDPLTSRQCRGIQGLRLRADMDPPIEDVIATPSSTGFSAEDALRVTPPASAVPSVEPEPTPAPVSPAPTPAPESNPEQPPDPAPGAPAAPAAMPNAPPGIDADNPHDAGILNSITQLVSADKSERARLWAARLRSKKTRDAVEQWLDSMMMKRQEAA